MKTLLPILFISILFYSCHYDARHIGSGDYESKSIKTDEFERITIEGGYQVTLKEGAEPEVIIQADNNLIDLVHADVRGNRLIISNEETIHSPDGIEVTIIYREISEINVSGACTLTGENTIEADDFDIKMGGAGAISLILNTTELTINISGAGAIELEGETRYLDVNMSGAGGLSAYDMIAENCRIDISGVGGAELYVEDELEARVSGLGGISYKGDPRVTKNEVSGLGSISHKN